MKPIDLERQRDLGRILDDAFALYRANWRTLMTVALVTTLPVFVGMYAAVGWLSGGYRDLTSTDDVTVEVAVAAVGALLAQLLIVGPLVTAAATHVVTAARDGERVGPGRALRAALGRLPALLPAMVLSIGGIALGLFALIIPGVFLAVRWVAVVQAVVVEDRRGAEALARSWELTRGHFWLTFLTWLVVNILVGVTTEILQLPFDAAGEEADTMLYPLLGAVLASVLGIPVGALAFTLLYFSLRARSASAPLPQRPEAPVPPPAPQSIEGVPGTYGDGWAPPRPPGD